MCVYCEIKSITREFRTFNQKWGDSQVSGESGGSVSYSFATQNFAGQFGTFDAFITEPGFQKEITTSLSSSVYAYLSFLPCFNL